MQLKAIGSGNTRSWTHSPHTPSRLPAAGRLTGRYGESTGLGPRAQGITLRTRRKAQVVAPYDGQVVFAGLIYVRLATNFTGTNAGITEARSY